MSTYGVLIDVDLKEAREALTRTAEKMSPVGMGLFMMSIVDPYLRERATARFANEGDDAVGKWAPLSETTRHIRGTMGLGEAHPINERHGQLREYILGTPGSFTSIGALSVLTFPGQPPSNGVLETKVRTAQQGKAKPRTPARPVLGLNSTDLAFITSALALYVEGTNQ